MLLIGLAPLARGPECVTVAGRARAVSTGVSSGRNQSEEVPQATGVDQPGGDP